MHASLVLLTIAMAAVLAVLMTGIAGFGKGGPWYQRNANRLMNLRVALQLVAVVILGFVIWLSAPP
jgi:hypothetical protein